jgi:hypothetical protein
VELFANSRENSRKAPHVDAVESEPLNFQMNTKIVQRQGSQIKVGPNSRNPVHSRRGEKDPSLRPKRKEGSWTRKKNPNWLKTNKAKAKTMMNQRFFWTRDRSVLKISHINPTIPKGKA